jgi:hypothetical protein
MSKAYHIFIEGRGWNTRELLYEQNPKKTTIDKTTTQQERAYPRLGNKAAS